MNERPREFVRPEYRYIYEKREEDVGGLRGAEGGGRPRVRSGSPLDQYPSTCSSDSSV